jgi:hypothetical protein
MGPEVIFLFCMVALEPEAVDSGLLMRYADSRVQLSQQLEAMALRQFTQDQIKYGGYVAAPIALIVNRQISVRWEFP